VFFPSAPSFPRLQYLAGINGSDDVEGKTSNWSLFSFGKAAQKKSRNIIKPLGVSAAGGKIYVADIAGQVAIIDMARKSFDLLKGNNGIGKLKKPVSVAVDDLGFLYVADVGRKEVVVYDREGEFLNAIGAGLGITPTDVAVDKDRIYILDTKEAVIKVLDRSTSALIMEIGKGFLGENKLSLPINFSLDKSGTIRITNAGTGKVVSCDRDGNFLGSFGEMGDGFGQFSRPRGIAVNDKEEIYIVDAGLQNVQVFSDKGRLLTYFGSSKLPVGGMNLPSGIALSRAELPFYQTLADKNFELDQVVFVTNQFGDPKISIYGFGKLRGVDYDLEYKKLQQEREKKARDAIEKAKRDEKKAQGAEQPPAETPR
jgi:DNA-binding beta-propeller fold protein YncE